MPITTENLLLYQSLFKGRTDVFSVRWEKEGKSGYIPAYDLDWNEYNLHKEKGGTFKDFKNKKYQSLSESKILEHLTGKQTIGVYPLLIDNTSWFIVADFDEKNWLKDCLLFLKICDQYKLPAYLERSRSGNGGHVWIFFEENYSAIKSRTIFKELLKQAQLSLNIKGSFDRLFPNQNSHSGVGIGNLIALPLQGKSLEESNSCFINLNGTVINDQWQFLKAVQRIPKTKLDELFSSLSNSIVNITPIKGVDSKKLQIVIRNQVVLNKSAIPASLMKFIKEQLHFVNQEFLVKKKFKKSTFNIEASFKIFSETDTEIILPRGFAGKLIRFCKEQNLPFDLYDQREKLPETLFKSKIRLKGYQTPAVEAADKKDFGIIVAPPGSGKTIIGLEIIARKKQLALIIVHRQQLFDQWLERIESFLGIPRNEVGLIAGGTKTIGKQITVAMIQSLNNLDIQQRFGAVVVDECHHIPAKTFRTAIEKVATYCLYGLTATPKRKYNDEALIYSYIGEIIARIDLADKTHTPTNKPLIIIRQTEFYIPFNSTDSAELLHTTLVNDTHRNQLIIKDISKEVRDGNRVLILTERKAHIQVLAQYLKTDFELVSISGEDSKKEREYKLQQIHSGDFQILISTGQFLGEGTDIPELDCLFLVFPFSFEGKLIQYIGRMQRGESDVLVYDYRDKKVEYLDSQFKQRNRYYNTLRDIDVPDDGEELLLLFHKNEVWVDNEDNLLKLSQLDIPEWITGFESGTCWKIKVIKFNKKVKSMLAEIIDYNTSYELNKLIPKEKLYNIERIVFKSIDHKLLERHALKIPVSTDTPESKKVALEFTIAFDEICFDYGYAYFHKHILQLGKTIKFRIENDFIRPEFEIIRDYFKKLLRFKTILVIAEIEYNYNQIISSQGFSKEIDRINSSAIDSVKFQYINNKIKGDKNKSSILTLEDLPKEIGTTSFFENELDLLDSYLENSQPRHYRQLKFLAKKHCSKVIKLRFILEPFSFLFLLEGNDHYHLIWETLDTEEATYLWHIPKEENLMEELNKIDLLITQTLQDGKFHFLDSKPEKFSRLYHDYSDLNKGFIVWKDSLITYIDIKSA